VATVLRLAHTNDPVSAELAEAATVLRDAARLRNQALRSQAMGEAV
jgi:hypothetical protein